jgi:ERCC4-type nuclease
MATSFTFVVDTREPEKLKNKAAEDYENISFEALSSGDFACRKDSILIAGIERKELKDAVGSLKNKQKSSPEGPPRLFDQMTRLRADYPVAFLILEGDIDSLYGFYKRFGLHFNEASFWGAITSISVRENIHILWTPRMSKTIDVAYRVCAKMAEGKYQLPKKWKPKSTNTPADLLELIPGVDKDIAIKLLKKYKSIEIISSQTLKELKTIDGVGPTTAKNIKRCLCEYVELV